MEMDRALANRLAAVVEPLPKQCYRNSILALSVLGDDEAVYVEGWLLILGLIWIEHGWLEVNGKIVDVTLSDTRAEDYHAVRRYTEAETKTKWRRGALNLPIFAHTPETRREMAQVERQLYQGSSLEIAR